MTRHPPFVGRVLLRAVVPASHRELVSGDLLEEFRTTKAEQLGHGGASRWYLWQVVRSAWPFLFLRVRRGEFAAELAVAQMLVIGTLFTLEALWGLIMGQVPLRAAAIAPGLQVTSLVASGLAAGVVGLACGSVADDGRRISPFALCAFVATAALVLGAGVGVQHVAWRAGLATGLGTGVLAGATIAARDPRRCLFVPRR